MKKEREKIYILANITKMIIIRNVGHSFYVADVLQGRLDEILPHLSLADSDYFSRWTNMHWAWWVIAPPQYFFEMARDYLVKKLF